MIIEGVQRAAPTQAARPGGTIGGFVLPAAPERPQGPPPAGPAAALAGILALQEAEADAVRDRRARQHGQALLKALATLQHALLSGQPDTAALHALGSLAAQRTDAATPGLAAVLAAVLVAAGAGRAGPSRRAGVTSAPYFRDKSLTADTNGLGVRRSPSI